MRPRPVASGISGGAGRASAGPQVHCHLSTKHVTRPSEGQFRTPRKICSLPVRRTKLLLLERIVTDTAAPRRDYCFSKTTLKSKAPCGVVKCVAVVRVRPSSESDHESRVLTAPAGVSRFVSISRVAPTHLPVLRASPLWK